ncbi:MAG: DUF3365 domain-containing protein [Desulfuromonadales bacterium]|nr:DUF3365 domain-containing protein [Desulfuromonadales bacterium]
MNTPGLMVHIRKYGLCLILVWTCILAGFLLLLVNEYREDTITVATREARDYHELNLQYRRWGAKVGGVYVATDKVVPNPYLTVPDRDVTTGSGKSLTLVNPAYMTRMVFEIIRNETKHPIINRLVSLKPLNPANAPNAWEQETLKLFEKREVRERSQVLTIEKRPYLQFMAAFITEESCLKCHAHQGYQVGDVRGGMSIAIPMSGYLAIEADRKNSLFGSFALLWALGVAGIAVSSNKRHMQEMRIVEKSVGLEQEIIKRQQTQEHLEEQTVKLEEEISERQQIQEQLEEQAAMLEEETAERQQAVQELQKKNVDMEQFIYTVSHDLRTPLVTVKNFLGFLENDLLGDNQKRVSQDFQFIHCAADKMKLLLDELLDLARSDHVETPAVRISFKDMLAEVLDTMAGVIKGSQVSIDLPETDLMLFGDRPRLCQIWQNLIENAIKYSREDRIPRIEIGVQQVNGEPVFFVKDNGIGIDPHYHGKVFKIFEKLDPKSPGAGMGLSMIRRIVEKCGGRIWVESEGNGKGSCFYFTLPLAVIQS